MSAFTCSPAAAVLRNQRASCSRSPAAETVAPRAFSAPFGMRSNCVAPQRPASLAALRKASGVVGAQRKPVVHVTTAGSVMEAIKVANQKQYSRPAWNIFEMGMSPVYWEPATPKAGELMTIWFNPEFTALKDGDYVAFNGGFNGPFMCGGSPRGMATKARGEGAPLYSVRIQVPRYAVFLEFGFTDGKNWDEGYTCAIESPKSLAGKDMDFYNNGLSGEMSADGACEAAIFPDPAPDALICMMPGGGGLTGQTCELNIIKGCTDPNAANYNPLATHDDNTCDIA